MTDRKVPGRGIGCQLRLGHHKQRPDDVAPPGRHAAEAVEAAAAQEMEQYRFGLIIGVMGHGNAFGPAGPGRFPQDAVAFAPAYGFFRRLFPPGQGRHVDVLPGKTAMAAHGFAPYQADFFIGRPADTVVDVAGRQGQPI